MLNREKRLMARTLVMGLVAIFIGTPLFAGEKSPDKIRIAYPPGFVIGTLDFLKVLDPYLKGFNIRMESLPVRGGAENAVAVAAGRAEFSIGSVSPAINVALEKGPLKIIVTHAFEDADYRAGTVIVARKEIKSWKDLKGKIMGTHRLGSLSDITARVLLKANGLNPGEDVTIIELPFGGMAPALKRNQAQALAFFTPYAAEVYKEGYGWELGKTADVIPLLTRECWFGNSDFMAKNRELSLRLTKAVLLATYEMAKISDEAYIKLIWDLWEGNKSILHDLSKYKMLHDRYIYDPSVLKESVATHVKLMEDYGVIKKTPAGFVDSIIDDSYWQQAYRELRGEKRLP